MHIYTQQLLVPTYTYTVDNWKIHFELNITVQQESFVGVNICGNKK